MLKLGLNMNIFISAILLGGLFHTRVCVTSRWWSTALQCSESGALLQPSASPPHFYEHAQLHCSYSNHDTAIQCQTKSSQLLTQDNSEDKRNKVKGNR